MSNLVRPLRFVGPAILIVGLAVLAFGFLQGEATFSLIVIFPLVTATGPWSVLGIVLMIAGFFLSFLGMAAPVESQPLPPPEPAPATGAPPQPAARRWGGVVFLGPVPIVFGSDPKMARWMLLVGIALFVGLVVLTVIALWGI